MIISIVQVSISQGLSHRKRDSGNVLRHTIDSSHNESNLHRIGGAGEVSIDLLLLRLVKGNKTVENVVARSRIVRATYITHVSK